MIRPVNKTCFIRPDWEQEEKAGRFFLPQVRMRDLPNTGVVKAIARDSDAEFNVGDHVIYDRHTQHLIEIDGERLTRVKVEDVQAVL